MPDVLGAMSRVADRTGVLAARFARPVRDGLILFAVDQQPYLQGYLPVELLTAYHRYGLLPPKGTLVPTGPVFVTSANAAQVLALAARGLR